MLLLCQILTLGITIIGAELVLGEGFRIRRESRQVDPFATRFVTASDESQVSIKDVAAPPGIAKAAAPSPTVAGAGSVTPPPSLEQRLGVVEEMLARVTAESALNKRDSERGDENLKRHLTQTQDEAMRLQREAMDAHLQQLWRAFELVVEEPRPLLFGSVLVLVGSLVSTALSMAW